VSRKRETVAAIDFGSRAIRVVIASRHVSGQTRILGYGSTPTQGAVNFGAIQDINLATSRVNLAITEAQRMANMRVHSLYCGIQGKTLDSRISDGKVEIENGLVKEEHLDAARHNASLESGAPDSHPVSCVRSEEWTVDDMRVADPIGMRGSVLKGRMHFTRMSVFLANNLRSCLHSQKKEITEFVYMPLAAAHGCLTLEDIRLGAAVINFGSTSTSVAVYNDNRLMATEVFEWGSGHFIRDVAAILKVNFEEATELVLQYGINLKLIQPPARNTFRSVSAQKNNASEERVTIKLHNTATGAPSTVDESKLNQIIYDRGNQFSGMIAQYLEEQGYTKHLSRGLVVTGGGAAIANQDRLLEEVSMISTRIGLPIGFNELPDPINTTEWAPTIGIVNYAFAHRRSKGLSPKPKDNTRFAQVKRFLDKYF
jgi:cell division protein FtsA